MGANGEQYDGEWKKNVREGFGTSTSFDGSVDSVYAGTWKNGVQMDGEFEWANGDKYKGPWKRNQMHGKGVFTWAPARLGDKGDVYEGDFRHGIRSGRGKWTSAMYGVYSGQFRNGLPHGVHVDGKNENIWQHRDGKAKSNNRCVSSPSFLSLSFLSLSPSLPLSLSLFALLN